MVVSLEGYLVAWSSFMLIMVFMNLAINLLSRNNLSM